MKYKAIIFDMDGVLFDTEEFYYKRRERFLLGKGISIKHLPPSFFIGGNMKRVWENILRDDYDKWDVSKLQKEYVAYKKNNPLPYQELLFPDVRKVLETLKKEGLKLALASSSSYVDIMSALEETDLKNYFDHILSGEMFAESKPNPEIYEEACKRLEVPKIKTLVIEDSEKGISAGKAAGLEVWGILDNRFGMKQDKADRLYPDLTAILSALTLSI